MDMKSLHRFVPLFALLILSLLLLLSCGSGSDDDDDGSSTGDDDNDDNSNTDDDIDDDISDDDLADDDDDTYPPLQCADGMCLDPSSGLTWVQVESMSVFTWEDAKTYCQELVFGGYDNWKLPSISELRTIVRGCPQTETDGSCEVTDENTVFSEQTIEDHLCGGCDWWAGPGRNGIYMPPEIKFGEYTEDNSKLWSSTECTSQDDEQNGACTMRNLSSEVAIGSFIEDGQPVDPQYMALCIRY